MTSALELVAAHQRRLKEEADAAAAAAAAAQPPAPAPLTSPAKEPVYIQVRP